MFVPMHHGKARLLLTTYLQAPSATHAATEQMTKAKNGVREKNATQVEVDCNQSPELHHNLRHSLRCVRALDGRFVVLS